MMALRSSERFSDLTARQRKRVTKAITSTGYKVARDIQREGRRDIASAGRFSAKTRRGLKAFKLRKRAATKTTVVRVTMNRFLRGFEFGAVLRGKPLLWIALRFAADARGMRARKYPAPLFRVDRPGRAPLLIAREGEPKYFGVEQVTEPKLFRVRDIAKAVAARVPQYYSAFLSKGT
jgi:hypothetical protein